jgi:hypothetical protein
MESIISYGVAIIILFVLIYLFTIINDKIEKMNHIARYILAFPYSIFVSFFIGFGIRMAVLILSFVWSEEDTILNVYTISYTLMPFITSYALVNASSFMMPNHKLITAIIMSILVISLNFYLYYLSFSNNILIFGDNLLDFFGFKRGSIGEIIYLISLLTGIGFGIKHSKSQDSFIGLEI